MQGTGALHHFIYTYFLRIRKIRDMKELNFMAKNGDFKHK
jgi:hypothetical protein